MPDSAVPRLLISVLRKAWSFSQQIREDIEQKDAFSNSFIQGGWTPFDWSKWLVKQRRLENINPKVYQVAIVLTTQIYIF